MTSRERPERKSQAPQLFRRFPATDQHGLVVQHQPHGDEEFAMYFREAGERLADTFSGRPSDDLLLVPWLFLMRHAVELTLKNTIRFAGALRRRSDHGDDPTYPFDLAALAARLGKNHRIAPLLTEVDHHLEALGVEKTPGDVFLTLTQLSQADPTGTAFRYYDPKRSPSSVGTHIDFPSLRAEIERALGMSASAIDVLEDYASSLADSQEMREEFEAELEAELAAEFGPSQADYL
ncbi:hypothetical protein [Rhodococcus sp. IEGM1428]|uniref:hypothetical protein n=1 Tax=Rhodococcus sp. IEGM1428 TaxID=3392191 RepID=UPI003D0B89EB